MKIHIPSVVVGAVVITVARWFFGSIIFMSAEEKAKVIEDRSNEKEPERKRYV